MPEKILKMQNLTPRTILRGAVFAVVLVIVFAIAPLRAQDAKTAKKAITGSVRDPACLAMHNMSGEKHRGCAIACAKKGVPLGIEADDGVYYIAVASGHPSESANGLLSKYAEQKVKVTGSVGEAKGIHVIEVEKVEPAS
jgi:hypothetical protein